MKKDEALSISNARLLSAAYFCLLAIVVNIMLDALLYGMGINQLLPTFQAVLLAAIFAACFGALFGEKIIHCPKPYSRKVFLWGFLMVIAALPFYDIFFLYLLNHSHPKILDGLSLGNIILTYFIIILYSFFLAGFWMAIAAGLAAMYLRGHVVYDILHSKNDKLKEPHKTEVVKTSAVKQHPLPHKTK